MQEPVRFKEEVGEAQLGECPAAAAVQVQGLVGLETWRQSGRRMPVVSGRQSRQDVA